MNGISYSFKKFIINFFDLEEINSLLEKSKQNQKELDKKYWIQKLKIEIGKIRYKYNLELQEKEAQIIELENILVKSFN